MTTTGTLTVTDVDTGENNFNTTIAGTGNIGSLTITTAGTWNYTVANSAVQSLGAGDSKTETFTVQSVDGTASQDITVTITGMNDHYTVVGTVSAFFVRASVKTFQYYAQSARASVFFVRASVKTFQYYAQSVRASAFFVRASVKTFQYYAQSVRASALTFAQPLGKINACQDVCEIVLHLFLPK